MGDMDRDRLAAIVGGIALAMLAIGSLWWDGQLSASMGDKTTFTPKKQSKRFLGIPRTELILAIMLMLVPLGLWSAGIQPNFWLAVSIWSALICFVIHISWETGSNPRPFVRVLPGLVIALIIFIFMWTPLKAQWKREHQSVVTYVYLFPVRNLLNGARAFLVEHQGPQVLNNVDVSLWDNYQGNGLHEHYPEIDPGPQNPMAPRVMWWHPSTSGKENYGILITSREGNFNEQVVVEILNGTRQIGAIVTLVGTSRILNECKDALLTSQLPWDQNAKPCSSSRQSKDLILTSPVKPQLSPTTDPTHVPSESVREIDVKRLDLKRRTLAISAELQSYAVYKLARRPSPPQLGDLNNNPRVIEYGKYENMAMHEYGERFRARVVTVRDELLQYGLRDDQLDILVDGTGEINLDAMKSVSQTLERLAKKL